MRRCRWRREWCGCGSSTVTLSKEHAGLVTRSGPGGRAVLNWKRPPGSGTAISCAWRSAPRLRVLECETAVGGAKYKPGPGPSSGRARCVFATVLLRVQEFERSLDALSEAHDLLDPAVHGWLLALHDWIVAWDLALMGRFDDAEPAARASVERFNAEGEVWLSVDPLNILAGIAEARGDLDGASATYEALLERCRAAGQRRFMFFSLQRLAALRAKQGDDAVADGLYEELVASNFNPLVSADAMVGQAVVARRLGDLARARALLDAAGSYYRSIGLPPARPVSSPAWRGGH